MLFKVIYKLELYIFVLFYTLYIFILKILIYTIFPSYSLEAFVLMSDNDTNMRDSTRTNDKDARENRRKRTRDEFESDDEPAKRRVNDKGKVEQVHEDDFLYEEDTDIEDSDLDDNHYFFDKDGNMKRDKENRVYKKDPESNEVYVENKETKDREPVDTNIAKKLFEEEEKLDSQRNQEQDISMVDKDEDDDDNNGSGGIGPGLSNSEGNSSTSQPNQNTNAQTDIEESNKSILSQMMSNID
jgi:hypothetical protein